MLLCFVVLVKVIKFNVRRLFLDVEDLDFLNVYINNGVFFFFVIGYR